MSSPFVPITIAYMAGVLLGWLLPLPLVLLFGAWAGLLGVAAVWPRGRAVALGAAVVLAGWTNLVVQTAVLSPFDLRTVAGAEPRLATVRGRLETTPAQRVLVRNGRENRRTSVVIKVEALESGGGWTRAVGKVAATMPGVLDPEFFGGRSVAVTGVLRHPSGPAADGLFDYRSWLAWQGIHYELSTSGPEDWRLEAASGDPRRPPMSDLFLGWAHRVLALGLPEEDQSVRLLWAMTLGWKTALTDEVSEPFVRTGTMHIFAISGLHIVLITGILVALLRVLQLPRPACGWVVVPLIWFYTAATGWQASAIRATLMMTVVVLGWALCRPSDLLNSLAAAGFVLLAWDPRQLFQASFQLSFFVVLAIALFARPIAEVQRRWCATDPFLPEELVPRWRRWLDRPLRWVVASVGTSTAAWLGSWPWIAHYFHVITPGGLIANLVIVPLSSLALMSNLGSLVCGTWAPWLTTLFNHSAWFWMTLLTAVCDWLARQPGTWFAVRSPGWVPALAYYGLLLGVMLPTWRQGRRWLASVAAPVLVLLVGFAAAWWRQHDTLTLTVLALRSGAAQWIDAPGRAADTLVDCGDEPSAQLVVASYLRARGVDRLANLALTHGDIRHVGGAEAIVGAFDPRRVIVSPAPSRSPSYRRLLQSPGAAPERRMTARAGSRLAGWTVLHPAEQERHPKADDNALVLWREFRGTRILLLSDLGPAGQEALVRREPQLRAEIVVAGIPAQGEPLAAELIETLRPRLIVLQDAEYPAHERASDGLCARLGAGGAELLGTSRDGTITLRLRPGGWEACAMNGRRVTSDGR